MGIIVCIEKAIKSRRIDTAQILDRVQKVREENDLLYPTDEALNDMKKKGKL
jgi:hypothetical protein